MEGQVLYHTILPTNAQGSVAEAKDFLHNKCTQDHLVQQRHSFMPITWAYAVLYMFRYGILVFSLSSLNFIQEVVKQFCNVLSSALVHRLLEEHLSVHILP